MRSNLTTILLKHIKEMYSILEQYGISDKSKFVSVSEKDLVFQKAILMCVEYIGELSKKLDESVRKNNSDLNWRRLSTSRNIIFHDYDIVDMDIISSVIFKDINALKLIKEIDQCDLKQALELVNTVFSEFVAVDYSERGKRTFEDYLKNKYDELSNDMDLKKKKIWACWQNGEIVGVLAVRDTSHIALMFVDKQHHRKGIAKYMFNHMLDDMAQNSEIIKITVNSSPYAVKVYERLGFTKTDEQQEKDGIIFTPMMRPVV